VKKTPLKHSKDRPIK